MHIAFDFGNPKEADGLNAFFIIFPVESMPKFTIFGDDVEAFLQFALTVIKRRKSRAGHDFENHLHAIFDTYGIKYSKGAKTERNNRYSPKLAVFRTST
ncbi:hypothetical protein D7322_25460 [Sphingobacterium puteale]|uniref:Restriction endonuclease type II EcoRII C-terminal domain-containing protein n=1 Tax=Sphingobacterium puteale TaxID=2420510 RepID=A0A420VR28_9SPHI|nr:type II restriction endonuclease [Sphingobacterium puteale]RKO68745.1 hypothetical protein D7322_25460 [Sphingobacterium puteale]